MFRCFTIATLMHCGLIVGLLILSFFTPPRPYQKPPVIRITSINNRGDINKPPGAPPPEPSPAGPDKKEDPAPAPTPEAPKPAPTPSGTPKPAPTPEAPKPARTPLIAPNKTPEPKPETQVSKTKPPTVKTPVPVKKAPEPPKKIFKNTKKLVEITPKPTPKPTPEPAPEAVVAEVTENSKPSVPPDRQAASLPDNTPAVPAVPAVPTAPPTPATGPGGQGSGSKPASPAGPAGGGKVFSGKIGGGGGAGGTMGGYGNDSILDALAQTYLSVVFQKIKENFTVPITRPGMQCVVQCMIDKSGTISNVKLITSTGMESYDRQALAALEMTKLPPLYEGLNMNSLTLNLTFTYENTN